MAWTVPMTFTANTALTAAQLNTHLRDNLLETATAKATAAGALFVAQGRYRIAERFPVNSYVSTAETTTATEFVDLATAGPQVTATTGSQALVFMSMTSANTSANAMRAASYSVEGATDIEPSDRHSIRQDGNGASQDLTFGQFNFVSNLTPGENVFTMKYKVGSGTGTFQRRRIVVFPL